MDSSNTPENNKKVLMVTYSWLTSLSKKVWNMVAEFAKQVKRIGEDDPRRIIHSFKVGLALTLVSMFYYVNPLYDGFGVNAMWAVLTVVVVFEFSVGATLGKGINRMLATLIAGILGFGVYRVATLFGQTGEPILTAIFVFIVAAIVTFTRFFPPMKARYDYGLTIFILTFCLVSVSGYRDPQILKTANLRVSTIIIGSCISIVISILICPVWIGEDLHNLLIGNIEKLGIFLEEFGIEYFKESKDEQSNDDKSKLQKYKSILASKSNEETMANLAKWEPAHGHFKFYHPWKQYIKIGTLTRECAYKIEALNNILQTNTQTSLEIQKKFANSCIRASLECGKTLKKLASTTKRMKKSNLVSYHLANSKDAAENIKSILKTNLQCEDANLADVISIVRVCSILLEVVESIEKIVDAINELASMVNFKSIDATISPEQPHLCHRGIIQPILSGDNTSYTITIKE